MNQLIKLIAAAAAYNFFFGVVFAQTEPDGTARQIWWKSHGGEDV